MIDDRNNQGGAGGEGENGLSRREVLLSRVVDGEATDVEWSEYRALADAEVPDGAPSAWRDLARAQRSQALMAGVVGDELAAAERVEAPARGLRLVGSGGGPVARAVATGGWIAVAAAMALAWANGWMARPPGSVAMPNASQATVLPAGMYKIDTPEDAVRVYKEKGREAGSVLQELPQRVLVQALAKECCPGQYTVIYVRQFVEKADVKDLYQFAQDEAGQPKLVRSGVPAASTVQRRLPGS